jgi:putative transposase
VTYQRQKLFSRPENIDRLLNVMEDVRRHHPFSTIAQVILPDHIHAIWELPPDDQDFPKRWRLIKTGFTKRFPIEDDLPNPVSRQNKNERIICRGAIGSIPSGMTRILIGISITSISTRYIMV